MKSDQGLDKNTLGCRFWLERSSPVVYIILRRVYVTGMKCSIYIHNIHVAIYT